jgi:hypothetical protein
MDNIDQIVERIHGKAREKRQKLVNDRQRLRESLLLAESGLRSEVDAWLARCVEAGELTTTTISYEIDHAELATLDSTLDSRGYETRCLVKRVADAYRGKQYEVELKLPDDGVRYDPPKTIVTVTASIKRLPVYDDAGTHHGR